MNKCILYSIVFAGMILVSRTHAQSDRADDRKSSRAYEAYFERETAIARQARLEAMAIERDRTMARLEAAFDESGDSAFVEALADMQLPAPEGIALWSRLMCHDHPAARATALRVLAGYQDAAVGLTNDAVALLADEHDSVVIRATEFILAAAPKTPALVDPFVQRLANPATSANVKRSLITVLASLGPIASDAIPALESQLDDENTAVAFDAFAALGAIRNAAPIETTDATVFASAVGFQAFESVRLGLLPRDTSIETLRDVLSQQRRPHIKAAAISALKDLRPSDPASAQMLIDAAALADDFISQLAVGALADFDTADPLALDVFVDALSHPSDVAANAAAVTLSHAASPPITSVAAVIAVLEQADGRTDYRRIGACLDLLRAIGTDAAAARPTLVQMIAIDASAFDGRNPIEAAFIRRYALLTLGDIGAPQEAIAGIVEVLANSDHPPMIAAAAHAAGGLDRGFDRVVPWLVKVLDADLKDFESNLRPIDSQFFIPEPNRTSARLEAIRALARMGPAAGVAIPILRERAADAPDTRPFYPAYQLEAALAAEALAK